MRRCVLLLTLAALVTALTGCEIVNHGGDLPPDRGLADSRYYDPWHGISSPLLRDDLRSEARMR